MTYPRSCSKMGQSPATIKVYWNILSCMLYKLPVQNQKAKLQRQHESFSHIEIYFQRKVQPLSLLFIARKVLKGYTLFIAPWNKKVRSKRKFNKSAPQVITLKMSQVCCWGGDPVCGLLSATLLPVWSSSSSYPTGSENQMKFKEQPAADSEWRLF